jgi:ATP-dependent helicase HrpB
VRLGDTDQLAGEEFLVAIDLDGKRKDARVRLAAAVDVNDLLETAGFDAEVTERTVWDRDRNDVVTRVERHLGALDLGTTNRRAAPGPAVTALLIDQVRRSRLEALTWTEGARALQARVAYLRTHLPDDGWPDLSDDALVATLEEWLAPLLAGAAGRADLEVISMMVALDVAIGLDRRRRLDRLLPNSITLASGRSLRVDYGAEMPTIASRAQDFYGQREHPTILDGALPVTVELHSPAGRPIQRTADLPGFWRGSWGEVRKEMAGRYPKHDWPVDPSA